MGTHDHIVPSLAGPLLGRVHTSVRSLHQSVDDVDVVEQRRHFRFLLLATLNALDLLTTSVVLRLGGAEANPLMAPHIDSVWRPTAIKLSILAVVWLTLTRLPLREQSVDRVVQAAIIVYGLVVAHNTLLYLSVG